MTDTEPLVSEQQVIVDCTDRINFATAQNSVPILRSVRVCNSSERELNDLALVARAQPAFIAEKRWPIDRIEAGGEVLLSDKLLALDLEFLSTLNEAEHGQLHFELEQGGEVLTRAQVPVEILARDEWGGLGSMEQILAAFVTPNDPNLPHILKEAASLLEAGGHQASLEGYQSGDPARAYMIAAAIWSSITGMGLTYSEPPKSFEFSGQKVRDAGRIVFEGLATCLDLSLFFASALEAVGLHPVVIFKSGHSLAGVWLIEKTFDSIAELDVTELRKAIAGREFVPFETTLATHRPPATFDEAVKAGRLHLSEAQEAEFDRAIDITRARSAGIRPLASHQDSEGTESESEEVLPAALPASPDFGLLPGDLDDEVPTTPQGRIERWQRKLLDLSLRNRLLNFVDTKQNLPFVCPSLSLLEDKLADGKRFRIVSLTDENPIGERDVELHRQETGEDIHTQFTTKALDRGEVCVPLTGAELSKRLITLNRRAKSDLSEGGTNTLFLAAGFLRWKKTPEDERVYRAPILLLPVKLKRRSAKSNFHLSHHEDDIRINSTLLEFLDRDFGLSIPALQGELPTDESGLDLPRIFADMRAAVRDVPGFEVVEDMALSTFSFAKYLMWKDMVDRTESLRSNRLVRHLIDNPDSPFRSVDAHFPTPEDVDSRHKPVDLLTPLPADSSQLSAVLAAAGGHDFVIIGPPGTGKSQTIANMIAHCMALGKSVLFVAEKSAALDVVYRRLKAYGLGDACLELHSNKADRRSVIAQLGAAWDRATTDTEAEWIQVTSDLLVARDKLNAYVLALHATGSHGVSIFEAIGTVAGKTSRFKLHFNSMVAHDASAFANLQLLSEQAARTFEIVADCKSLQSITHEDWSFAWQSTVLELIEQFQSAAAELLTSADQFEQQLGLLHDPNLPTARLAALFEFAELSERTAARDFSIASNPDFDEFSNHMAEFETTLATLQTEKEKLTASYSDSELDRIPIEDLDRQWREACSKFWPFSVFAKSKTRKLLQTYSNSGKSDPGLELEPLRQIRAAVAAIVSSPLQILPGFNGVDTNSNELRSHLALATELRRAALELADFAPGGTDMLAALSSFFEAGGDSTTIATAALEFLASKGSFGAACSAYESHAGGNPSGDSIRAILEELAGVVAEKSHLADWTKWVSVRREASECGLDPLLEALYEDGVAEPIEAFRVAYFTWWLPLALDSSQELRTFAHWDHENQIESFRKLDIAAQALAAKQVQTAVSHDLPARDAVARKSELGTLRHQLGLQRPSASIRNLIGQMPETITKLAPCVLMSPLSVAQYLPTNHAIFDMVIFDEASQITTWDAVGAIARGTQSIIVGDPKQLPPTNFFGRSTEEGDEELEDYEKDLPSILDEATVAGLPTHQLNWHYRSRDESLIAFSNHHYYGERLVTFPSPATDSDAVIFHKLDGIYARGSGRTNTVEAEAIVEFAVERMQEWLLLPEAERLTLGVITFNVQQQELILDLFDAARREAPELEWFFDDEREEPTIVKNIENIQGDERDYMLFSITFGPDTDGKITMNFGAINNDGGEKRLNVAVTRARAQLHIYSSLTADQIDLTRSKARGVEDLKNFLDYAERGAVALPAGSAEPTSVARNQFETAIGNALEARGWDVQTAVGVSGFRIDIGIVHPDSPETFLAGIECDGATYHRSASARDRDKIRESVLENLGWSILRVWSTDWFRDPETTIERTDAALRELLETARENAKELIPIAPEPSAAPTESDQEAAEVADQAAGPAEPEAESSDPDPEAVLDEETDLPG